MSVLVDCLNKMNACTLYYVYTLTLSHTLCIYIDIYLLYVRLYVRLYVHRMYFRTLRKRRIFLLNVYELVSHYIFTSSYFDHFTTIYCNIQSMCLCDSVYKTYTHTHYVFAFYLLFIVFNCHYFIFYSKIHTHIHYYFCSIFATESHKLNKFVSYSSDWCAQCTIFHLFYWLQTCKWTERQSRRRVKK